MAQYINGKKIGNYYDITIENAIRAVAGQDIDIYTDSDKTFELQDTVWDDQQVDIGTVGKGASFPLDTAYKGSEILEFQNGQDNIIYFIAQLSHRYKLGTDIEFHAHCTVPDNNGGVVRWVFTYSWADIGNDFPAQTTTTTNVTVNANSQDQHLYHEVDPAVSSASGEGNVSGFLLCSLMREATHLADTYGNSVYVTGIDFHFEIDTMGSRGETSK